MLKNLGQRYEKEMKTYEKKDKIIIKYKQYLRLEKSLSDNTVQAYLTDLDKLFAYLTLENIDYANVTLQDLETFSAGLHDIGIHPRSQARILSGIRSFYHFLVLEDYIQQDPAELLESPQIGKHLPDVLSVEDRCFNRKYRPKHTGRTTQLCHSGNPIQLRTSSFGTLQLKNIRSIPQRRLHKSRRKREQATSCPYISTSYQ